jgi:hypothetical protein
MNKYPYHDYIVSQLLDYGVDKIVTLEQNVVDMMIQHKPKGICSVDNIRSHHTHECHQNYPVP